MNWWAVMHATVAATAMTVCSTYVTGEMTKPRAIITIIGGILATIIFALQAGTAH